MKWMTILSTFNLIMLSIALLVPILFLPEEKEIIIQVKPLNCTSKIYIDAFGVPTIQGTNDNCTYFGLGYVHAQDRLMHIHFMRTVAKARLSEQFGINFFEIDEAMFNVRLEKIVSEELKLLSNESLSILNSFSFGINYYVNTSYFPRLEFLLSGAYFYPFSVEDCLYISKLIDLVMNNNWGFLLMKQAIREAVGDELYAYLNQTIYDEFESDIIFPKYTQQNFPNLLREEPELPPFIDNLYNPLNISFNNIPDSSKKIVDNKNMNFPTDQQSGSNAWAISGDISESSFPLIANDPHLPLTIPSLFYFARIHLSNITVKGATYPGVPCFASGRNNFSAWSIVIAYAETSDTYQIDMLNDTHYKYGNASRPLELYCSTRKVKKQGNKVICSKWTHHGPFLRQKDGDSFCKILGLSCKKFLLNQNISIAILNYYKSKSSFVESMISFYIQPSIKKMMSKIRHLHGFNIQVVYGTNENTISAKPIFSLPVRKSKSIAKEIGNGSNPNDDWREIIINTDFPENRNPKEKYIAACNNKFTNDSFCSSIMTQTRCSRIKQMVQNKLKKNESLSIEYLKEMQKDTKDLFGMKLGQNLIKIFDRVLRKNESNFADNQMLKNAADKIRKWNGVSLINSSEPILVYSWFYKIMDFIKSKIFSEEFKDGIGRTFYMHYFIYSLIKNWNKNQNISLKLCGMISCDEKALELGLEALNEVAEFQGNDLNTWKFGYFHISYSSSTLFGKVPFLSALYSIVVQGPGNFGTINVAANYNEGKYQHGVTLRMIHDLSSISNSYYVAGAGQSESYFSFHFDDQAKLIGENEYLEL